MGLRRPLRFRRLRLTRDGWYYCAFAIGVGLAALNTGNNLLFLVLGLQLAAIILSGVLSERSLRHLVIRRELPRDPSAGEPFTVGLVIRNVKPFWPSYTLVLREPDGPVAGSAANALVVPPRSEVRLAYRARAPARGRFELWRIEVATRFPFGLFEKLRDVPIDDELWVLPRRARPPEGSVPAAAHEGARPDGRPGSGDELWGLVDLRPGDDRRTVHWRKSAAAGRLLKVERERERRHRVTIVLDNRVAPARAAALEHAVVAAAALARRHAARGLAVGFACSGASRPPDTGPAMLRRILRDLAVLGPNPGGPPPRVAPGAGVVAVRVGEVAG